MEKVGLIQVYTGDGKGKTTAAIGQAIRALGHGFKVGFVFFFKDPERFESGEYKILKKLGVNCFLCAKKHPHFYKNLSFEEVRGECLKGIELIRKLFREGSLDMLVLDEINIALRDGFLEEGEVLSLFKEKPKNLELVLTGRGATEGILREADLVSEVKLIKHPYYRGIKRRRGIEY